MKKFQTTATNSESFFSFFFLFFDLVKTDFLSTGKFSFESQIRQKRDVYKYKSLFIQNRQSAAFFKKIVVGMPISICTNKSPFNFQCTYLFQVQICFSFYNIPIHFESSKMSP